MKLRRRLLWAIVMILGLPSIAGLFITIRYPEVFHIPPGKGVRWIFRDASGPVEERPKLLLHVGAVEEGSEKPVVVERVEFSGKVVPVGLPTFTLELPGNLQKGIRVMFYARGYKPSGFTVRHYVEHTRQQGVKVRFRRERGREYGKGAR